MKEKVQKIVKEHKKRLFAIGIVLLGILIILGSILTVNLIQKNSKEKASIVIKNAEVLTINSNMDVINNGTVVVKDNKIIDIGDESIVNKYNGEQTIDANGGIVMPGMVNCHQHIPMIAFRGLGEENVSNRVYEYFMPLEGTKITRDLVYISSIHGCIEMAEGGTTTFCDMYQFENSVAAAAKKIGVRGVLSEVVIDGSTRDAKESAGGLAYAKDFITHHRDNDLITPAVGPHSNYTLSSETLLKCKELADKYDVPLICHIDEMENEAELMGITGSVIEYLDKIGFLCPRLICDHMINVSSSDLDIIKKRGCKVSYNPKANAKDATGIAPVKEMLEKGISVGIGTDGPMSNNDVDILSSLSYAASMQRIKYKDVTQMSPKEVVKMATIEGAKVLGLDDKIGSLEIGKLADIVILTTDSPYTYSYYDPYATLVFNCDTSDIDKVIINGQKIVSDGHILNYDRKQDEKDMNEIRNDVSIFAHQLEEQAKRNSMKKD